MVGVDGLGSEGNISGGFLWERRVYPLLGSSFLMLKPYVVIDGTMCLEEKRKTQ